MMTWAIFCILVALLCTTLVFGVMWLLTWVFFGISKAVEWLIWQPLWVRILFVAGVGALVLFFKGDS